MPRNRGICRTILYSSLLKPLLYTGRDALYMPITFGEYDIVASTLVSEIHDNYQRFKESFDKPMPFYIGVPQNSAEKMSVIWDTSYTFNSEAITYSFELARDYTFENPIVKLENLTIPMAEVESLSEGQYFIRVKAYDSGGQSQTAFDSYMTDGGKVYGTRCFYIDARGNVVEDVYVED